jgi:hypothetical protein
MLSHYLFIDEQESPCRTHELRNEMEGTLSRVLEAQDA